MIKTLNIEEGDLLPEEKEELIKYLTENDNIQIASKDKCVEFIIIKCE